MMPFTIAGFFRVERMLFSYALPATWALLVVCRFGESVGNCSELAVESTLLWLPLFSRGSDVFFYIRRLIRSFWDCVVIS